MLSSVAPRLLVVSDDLFFAARVQAAAARLGLQVEQTSAAAVEQRAAFSGTGNAAAVVVLQLTLHPERQLTLLQRLRSLEPPPVVVAISGHLETELRRKAKALGAVLASHSAMDRALARACGLSGDGAPRADR